MLTGRWQMPADLKNRPEMRDDFMKEMRRFLPAATVRDTIEKEAYWSYLIEVVEDVARRVLCS